MGLIDVDKLKKDLESVTLSNGTLVNTNTVLALLDKYPTVYDVDKVVEQLEKKMKKARDKEQENTSEYFEGEADGFEFAIEIVKKGGNEQ